MTQEEKAICLASASAIFMVVSFVTSANNSEKAFEFKGWMLLAVFAIFTFVYLGNRKSE